MTMEIYLYYRSYTYRYTNNKTIGTGKRCHEVTFSIPPEKLYLQKFM